MRGLGHLPRDEQWAVEVTFAGPSPAARDECRMVVQNAVREHPRCLRRRHPCRWYEGIPNGKYEDMQIPAVHIETLHNPVRYTYAQACAIAQC